MNCVARMIVSCALSIFCVGCLNGSGTYRTAFVCHQTGHDSQVIEISAADPQAHTAQGDHVARGIMNNPYLRGATYRLALRGDLSWNDAWYVHPPGLGNTLVADEPPGSRVPYDPARPCPG